MKHLTINKTIIVKNIFKLYTFSIDLKENDINFYVKHIYNIKL